MPRTSKRPRYTSAKTSMLRPIPKQRSGIIKSVSAPTGGWNARDNIADMEPTDAVIMDNWFPNPTDVSLRNGWSEHAYGMGAQVETLMAYNAPDNVDLLFAAAGESIWDATGATAVMTAEITGLDSVRFQWTNFTNSDGDVFLFACNGVDNTLCFNGATWGEVTNASVPAMSGIDTDLFIGVMVHKRRLWFVETDSLNAWYLPADSAGGLLRKFSLNGIAGMGGSLMSLGTWTLDAGAGPDDYWVAVTSEGQVAVYQGTDPNSVTTWGLVGVWNIGQPLGRRCLTKWAGDLLITCIDGVLPLSKALISSRVDPRVALTDKIQGAMSDATTLFKDNFGWETIFLPSAKMLLLNVPESEGTITQQFAMNTITGSWGRFTGIVSNCWCVFREEFYFGADGIVGKFWEVPDDNGSNINADCLQAFNYFDMRTQLKRWTWGRPILLSNGIPVAQLGLNIDYDTTPFLPNISFTPVQFGVWDTSLWDEGIWGGGQNVFLDWQALNGIGFCAGIRLAAQSQGLSVRWQATDIVFEPGNFIV